MFTTLSGRSSLSVSWKLEEEDDEEQSSFKRSLKVTSDKVISVEEKDSPIKTVVGQTTIMSNVSTNISGSSSSTNFEFPNSPPGKRDVFARLMKTAAASMFDDDGESQAEEVAITVNNHGSIIRKEQEEPEMIGIVIPSQIHQTELEKGAAVLQSELILSAAAMPRLEDYCSGKEKHTVEA